MANGFDVRHPGGRVQTPENANHWAFVRTTRPLCPEAVSITGVQNVAGVHWWRCSAPGAVPATGWGYCEATGLPLAGLATTRCSGTESSPDLPARFLSRLRRRLVLCLERTDRGSKGVCHCCTSVNNLEYKTIEPLIPPLTTTTTTTIATTTRQTFTVLLFDARK